MGRELWYRLYSPASPGVVVRMCFISRMWEQWSITGRQRVTLHRDREVAGPTPPRGVCSKMLVWTVKKTRLISTPHIYGWNCEADSRWRSSWIAKIWKKTLSSSEKLRHGSPQSNFSYEAEAGTSLLSITRRRFRESVSLMLPQPPQAA
jgi:hypothetical protein